MRIHSITDLIATKSNSIFDITSTQYPVSSGPETALAEVKTAQKRLDSFNEVWKTRQEYEYGTSAVSVFYSAIKMSLLQCQESMLVTRSKKVELVHNPIQTAIHMITQLFGVIGKALGFYANKEITEARLDKYEKALSTLCKKDLPEAIAHVLTDFFKEHELVSWGTSIKEKGLAIGKFINHTLKNGHSSHASILRLAIIDISGGSVDEYRLQQWEASTAKTFPYHLSIIREIETFAHFKYIHQRLDDVQQHQVITSSAEAVAKFEEGEVHYAFKRYSEALPCYARAACLGYEPAKAKIPYCRNKLGEELCSSNPESALNFFTQATSEGLADAELNLGHFYDKQKQMDKALHWYHVAAEHGIKAAQDRIPCLRFEIAQVLLEQKDETCIEEAITHLRAAADAGNSDAQYHLGLCLESGRSVEKRNELAVFWYAKAADAQPLPHMDALKKLGDSQNQYQLAILLLEGTLLPKDEKAAIVWLEKAVVQDHVLATSRLGLCYLRGCGTAVDVKKANALFEKAAAKDCAFAQYRLGRSFERNDRGQQQNFLEAAKWFEKASLLGHKTAKKRLPNCQYRAAVALLEQRADAKAISYLRPAAEAGIVDAQFQLACCYEQGRGLPLPLADEKSAFEWYNKAARQNHGLAQFQVACRYEVGLGTTKDAAKAVHWYSNAAEHNIVEAQFRLAKCFLYGIGIQKNYQQALFWFKRAADQRHSDAAFMLAECYEQQNPANYFDAITYYKNAEAQGHPRAKARRIECQFLQAEYYYDALDIATKLHGFPLLKEAAAAMHIEATNLLGIYYLRGWTPSYHIDFNEALTCFTKATTLDTESENPNGVYRANMALCYFKKGDYANAIKWSQIALNLGYEREHLNLKNYFDALIKLYNESSVDQRCREQFIACMDMLEPLSETEGKANSTLFYCLGARYSEDWPIANLQKAMYYFQKQNDLENSPAAKFNIGLCFKKSKEYIFALGPFLFALQQDSHYTLALQELDACFKSLEDAYAERLPPHITNPTIPEARRMELQILKKVADANYPRALNLYGMCYVNGEVEEKPNYQEAIKYFRQAEALMYHTSRHENRTLEYVRCNLGYAYKETGDLISAISAYQRAIDCGSSCARSCINNCLEQIVTLCEDETGARLFLHYEKILRDYQKIVPVAIQKKIAAVQRKMGNRYLAQKVYPRALDCYIPASEYDHEAKSQLAMCNNVYGEVLRDGKDGFPHDEVSAAMHFRLAADSGLATAQFNYACHLEKHNYYKNAICYYQLACDQHHVGAQQKLPICQGKLEAYEQGLAAAQARYAPHPHTHSAAVDAGLAAPQRMAPHLATFGTFASSYAGPQDTYPVQTYQLESTSELLIPTILR